MNKEGAIEYLVRHGKIRDIEEAEEEEEGFTEEEEQFYTEEEKEKILEVMKRGKIYGDPLVEIEG